MRMPKANQTFLENPEINLQQLSHSTVVERMLVRCRPRRSFTAVALCSSRLEFFKYGGVRC
jgi:hypothetical protein